MWYALVQNAQLGPMGRDELVNLGLQGVVNGDTSVWCEGMTSWQPLRNVESLADVLALCDQKHALETSFEDEDDEEGATLMLDANENLLGDMMAQPQVAQTPIQPEAPRAVTTSNQGGAALLLPGVSNRPSLRSYAEADALAALNETDRTIAPDLEDLQASTLSPNMQMGGLGNQVVELRSPIRASQAPLPYAAQPNYLRSAVEYDYSSQPPITQNILPPQPKSKKIWPIIAVMAAVGAFAVTLAVFLKPSAPGPGPSNGQTQPGFANMNGQMNQVQGYPQQNWGSEGDGSPFGTPRPETKLSRVQETVQRATDRIVWDLDQWDDNGVPKAGILTFDAIEVPQAISRADNRPPKPRDNQNVREPKAPEKKNQDLPIALTRDQILKVINAHAANLKGCVEKMPETKGTTINMQVVIKRDGSVSASQVTTARVRNTELSRCVESQVKSYRFDPFSGDPMRIQLPFSL